MCRWGTPGHRIQSAAATWQRPLLTITADKMVWLPALSWGLLQEALTGSPTPTSAVVAVEHSFPLSA